MRLITFAELSGAGGDTAGVAVDQVLELADGRRVPVLEGRGWGWVRMAWDTGERLDPWEGVTVEEVEADARMVAGPDEPGDGETPQDAEDAHWAMLATALRARGVEAAAEQLAALPDEVVLGERLRGLLAERGA